MTDLERKVIEQLCAGDEKAFEYVFKTFYSQLYNYSLELLKDSHLAEEIVEETFVKLWEFREKIKIETSFKAYLYRTIYNQCMNHFKHEGIENKYRNFFLHHKLPSNGEPKPDIDFPLSKLLFAELEHLVEKSINDLPDQCQMIFKMSRHQNLKNAEIAEKLGISVNTVNTQICRALLKLKVELKEYLPVIVFAAFEVLITFS